SYGKAIAAGTRRKREASEEKAARSVPSMLKSRMPAARNSAASVVGSGVVDSSSSTVARFAPVGWAIVVMSALCHLGRRSIEPLSRQSRGPALGGTRVERCGPCAVILNTRERYRFVMRQAQNGAQRCH